MTTNSKPALPSYRSLIDDATRVIYNESETPRIDAEVLMQHIIQNSLAWLIAYGDTPSTTQHKQSFDKLVKLREQGQPIAYLIGYKEFWTLKLKVNKHVLIPRPDTEVLVEQALSRIDKRAKTSILDLGTGSGAIGLALAKERPNSQVLAIDTQIKALDVAKQNAADAKLTNVSFLISNWYDEIHQQKFDLIAANPPYIHAGDSHLIEGDLRFEPDCALVGGDDGLQDIRSIVNAAGGFLNDQGWLFLEHGYDQQAVVNTLFKASGFTKVETYLDLNDLPRCTAGQLASNE